ncbi:hypothetical protein B0H12DRAFT_1095523 [Mycena haematopus]|nr:hypothetical protein B0H12DRAFT_1095523 [Mycena haematopus]
MNKDMAALVPIFIVLALAVYIVLFFRVPADNSTLRAACLCWCLLGSCMGAPILESLGSLWEYLVLSARASGDRTLQSRRRAAQGRFSEVEEEWEMNYRGSRTY